MFLNRMQERKRVANGKPQKIKDKSMVLNYGDADDESVHGELEGTRSQQARIGDQALLDLTDGKNDEFIYIY